MCGFLLAALRKAGVGKAFILLRRGKWDIPALLGSGSDGLEFAYRVLEPTASVPETLDGAYPFTAEATVALGFPDTIFEPTDAYVHLLRRLDAEDGEKPQVVLGCVPSDRSENTDMVDADAAGRVRRIVVKQADTGLRYAWIIAVWTPAFSRFLHDAVAAGPTPGRELYPGHVIQAAVDAGMRVDAVHFPQGRFLDVGTPEDLERARRGTSGHGA